MALQNPFIIYGYTYEGTSTDGWTGTSGIDVTVHSPVSSSTVRSKKDGYFSVDIQYICQGDGDNIGISGQNDEGYRVLSTSGNNYTLDITDFIHQQDLHLDPAISTGDIIIYYDTLWYPNRFGCWCSRWDVQNYNVIIETWLKKSDLQSLRDNITPQAVGELYKILGRPLYYDKTWSAGNTLMVVPNLDNYSTIKNMRDGETLIYVKNISDSPIPGASGWLNVKIEGQISGSVDL